MHLTRTLTALAILMCVAAAGSWAQDVQRPWMVEVHGGISVPTFDIEDLVDPGPSIGIGLAYQVSERVLLMAEGDLGLHSGAGEGAADVNVFHYLGKVGYLLYRSEDGRLRIFVNAGLGAMTFDPDVDEADAQTYFAINAGAKLHYLLTERIGLVVSPQGDIAFTSEEDGFTGSTGWVWPFSAGFSYAF